MTPRTLRLYQDASEIIVIAMGRERVKYPREGERRTKLLADEDPLAWWLGVEAVVAAAKRYRGELK